MHFLRRRLVGASLAGRYSGMALVRKGWKVCILDRKSTISIPVRFGEATGNRRELARFVPVNKSWIASNITGVALPMYFPDFSSIKISPSADW